MSLTVAELEKLLSLEMARSSALEAEVARLKREPFTELSLFLGDKRTDALRRDVTEGSVMFRMAADKLRRGRNMDLAIRLENHAKRFDKISAYLRMRKENDTAAASGEEARDG